MAPGCGRWPVRLEELPVVAGSFVEYGILEHSVVVVRTWVTTRVRL